VIEAKHKAAIFSSKPFGEGTAFGSLASQRETLLAFSPDFYSNDGKIVPIKGLAEYVVDRRVVNERRS